MESVIGVKKNYIFALRILDSPPSGMEGAEVFWVSYYFYTRISCRPYPCFINRIIIPAVIDDYYLYVFMSLLGAGFQAAVDMLTNIISW